MVEKLQTTLRDNAFARWAVLILVASMMFFAYMFVDILSPLASVLEQTRGWDQGDFGTYASGEYLLNVFGFLILAGISLGISRFYKTPHRQCSISSLKLFIYILLPLFL